MTESRNLLVLGCSATKTNPSGIVPAINLYDGPTFKVLRSFLRDYRWPSNLSVAVLSAKYGLIGALTQIGSYNQRMTEKRASQLNPEVTAALVDLGSDHGRIDLVMGRGYLESIDVPEVQTISKVRFTEGPIGEKLNRLHRLLRRSELKRRRSAPDLAVTTPRALYFLPDWDDFVDARFDFLNDQFSKPRRLGRKEEHVTRLASPRPLADGVLVSLAQHLGRKGLLKRVDTVERDSLSPRSVKTHFGLADNQLAFGDCGAFSYSSDDEPSISVEQAVHVYDLYEFDLGASVDHIPLEEVVRDGKVVRLTMAERKRRLQITRDNAASFLQLHARTNSRFIPVGVIQGIAPSDYADSVGDYLDMGYRHLALGGLVPRSDAGILEIVEGVARALAGNKERPWIHLLGVFRPKLQSDFRRLNVNSFDSASYFRKAWLRSNQNYLSSAGRWYAAIRIPPSSDPRTLLRLKERGVSEKRIQELETAALRALRLFDSGRLGVEKCLDAVRAYDTLLARGESAKSLFDSYRRTLEDKPWRKCDCRICRTVGIDVLIFRGLNRNKRRGAHNTLQLFESLDE
jgi:hypothetical protein